MKKYSKVLSLLLALAMILPGFAQPVQAAEGVKLERLAGLDRVETAIKVSQKAYDKADTVVLAGYNGEADALTGTLLAKDKNAPVLLTYKDKLDADLVAELNRLGAKKVYILGGETVVFTAVETALKDAGFTTSRLKGDTRVETAVAIATEVLGSSTPTEAFAVEYNSLADALAIGPVAANKKAPILITYKDTVPAKTEEAMKAMQVKDLTVIGGTNALTEKGKMALEAITGKEVTRVSGSNRELTSLEIANKYNKNPKAVVVANGYKSADALVGGYFAAMMDAPILLTNTNKITLDVLAFIKDAEVNTYVLGGETAVSGDVYTKVEEQLVVTEEDLKVESVSAINAKTIEVTFNKAVAEADQAKAEFELLRGTFKQNTTVEWAEDGMSATLTVAGKLQDSKYTVNVSGLTEEVLTKTITVEAQKVASIEILDDIAVLSGKIATGEAVNTATATVGYQVKDQYGEDITKTTTLKTNNEGVNKITADKAKGVVTLGTTVIAGKKVGDLVPVVLIHEETGVTTTKSVKLSDASAVDTLEIEKIYNKDSKELNEDSNGTEFFLVLNLKDQYGKEITNKALAEKLIATSTNDKVVSIAKANGDLKVETKEIDKKDRLVLSFDKDVKAGTSKILLISSTNGATTEFEVVVAETTRTDAVDLGQPEIAVKGEKVLLPLTVQDKEGNVVTDVKVLRNSVKGIKIDGTTAGDNLVIKDKKTFVELPIQTKVGYETVVVTSSTNKVATVTFEVKETATATAIRGLKKPLVIRAGDVNEVPLDKTYFEIEDQYGRVMKTSDKAIKVQKTEEAEKVVAVADNSTTVTGLKNGKTKLVVSLNGVADSEIEISVQVTDGKQFTSYEIEKFEYKVKAGTATEFTVNGILGDNGKTELLEADYSAKVINAKGVEVGSISNEEITIAEKELDKKDPKAEDLEEKLAERVDTEFTLRVLVEATGKTIEERFVVSADARAIEEFIFTEAAIEVTPTDADVKEAKEKEFTKVIEVTDGTFDIADLKNVLVTDQYGKQEIKAATGALLTIVPADATKVAISNNGKTNATATLASTADKAEITVKVKIGNATKEVKANIVKAAAVVNAVEITGASSLEVLAVTKGNVKSTYTATVKDQYSATMASENVVWSLKAPVTGVEVNAATGEVTVADTTRDVKFTVVAKSAKDSTVSVEKEVTLTQETE